MTEQQYNHLVKKAQHGDVAAFEELIKAHKTKLFYFTLNMTGGDHAAASDVLQEALIKAFLNIHKVKGQLYFLSWIWRILRNELSNYHSSKKTRPLAGGEEVEFKEDGKNSEVDAISTERRENMRKLVAMLPVKFREVVAVVELQEMSYDEAAEVLGISVDNIKVRLFRARKKLSELAHKHKELFF